MTGNHIIELEETESTNRYAFELIKDNEVAEGTVVSAKHQRSGRGLGGNKWESEAGKNITASIILKPSFLPLQKQFMLNIFTSLSVCDMISQLLQKKESIKIKWPNDVYVDNKKISGILIENMITGNTLQYSVIGIGINVNQKIFLSNALNPVSLKNISGKNLDIKKCFSLLCSCLDKRYMQLKDSAYNSLNNDYLSLLYRKGEKAKYIFESKTISAVITGISEEGKLILKTDEQKIIECNFKEIEFII
jgi:BirA family biotin operon repressor/biotin-[acetyl-CoA-carboxylase] ligase